MKKLLLTLATILSLTSLSYSINFLKVGNALTWHKVEGNGIYYRIFIDKYYFQGSNGIKKESTINQRTDTLLIVNYPASETYWFEYRLQAIDSLGTKSGISDPVFYGKDTCFTIFHYKNQDVYDTTVTITYKYLYDTIVKYDTVKKIKYNVTYNKTYDTVKFEYPIDTLTYTFTNIIDINVSGVEGYRVEYFDLMGRLLDKKMIPNGVFILIVYDDKDNIIDIRKTHVLKH